MSYTFSEANAASTQRLENLARALSRDELRRTNPDGWTVAGLLAHLAFWDQRLLVLLRRWQAQGVDESPVDPDMINDAMKPLALALEPQAAVEVCLDSARSIDAALEAISPELIEQIEASPTHFRFNRALHREGHMAEIQALLGR